jgi:hypothetical protein
MKSLLHSAKSKKMTVLLGKVKRYHNDSYRFNSLLQILLQSGLMAMEPQTGNISMGWRYHHKYFQYDHVGSKTSRFYIQAICHATAIEQLNMSLATRSLMRHLQCRWTSSCYRSLVTKKLTTSPRNGN